MKGTISLDGMRLFAAVADAGSLIGAARSLGMPKQTVSRRLAELETSLGVSLATRTTRRLRLTDVGQAYASQCAEVVRLADLANRAVTSDHDEVRGTLRVTAPPGLGETFLPALVAAYLSAHPEVRVEVQLTYRYVDLVEEGVDLAFRIGPLGDASSLIATRLGPARLLYVATPAYLVAHGEPVTPAELADHDCIALAPQPGPVRWPMFGPSGPQAVAITPRLRVDSLPVALESARQGLGIANVPAFAAETDLAAGRLRTVLDAYTRDVGGVHVVYPHSRFMAARVRRFVDLAVATLRPPNG